MTREQCLWSQARADGRRARGPSNPKGDAGLEVGWESEGSWTRLETMLRDAASWLAEGLGGDVVSEQARAWCAETPTVIDKGHGPSWVCHVHDPPRIGGRDFTLESGSGGVLAVGARDFSGEQSERVVGLALDRWRSWCVDSRFSAVERFQDEDFHRCALPGGPLLVVGRFPQDLEADLWQVSLTVMGAG